MLSSYEIGLLSYMSINILLGLSVFVILATGQLSVGNAGFMALGAYLSSYLTANSGLPIGLSLVMAALFCSLVGIAVGLPVLRLSGIYLAMATLGFGEIVRAFFLVFPATGAERGYFGMPYVGLGTILLWTLFFVLLVAALYHSRVWLGLQAVEDDEFVAQLTGLNTTLLKVGAFALGGAMAGVAGGLYAHFNAYIEPSNFSFLLSVDAILFVILGGSQTYWGPILGAVLLTLLPEYLRFMADWRLAFFGALLIAMLIFRPQGLITRSFLGWIMDRFRPKRKPEGGMQV